MPIDLKMVRIPGIVFLIALAVCFGAIQGGMYYQGFQEKKLRKEKRRLKKMQRKHNTAAADVEQVHVNYPRFLQMQKRGVVGVENRIAWVENLTTHGRRMHLSSLSYAISPPRDWSPTFITLWGDVGLYVSDMTLETKLLHEGDLLRLLERLQESSQGLFTVGSCELKRIKEKINRSSADPNIDGRCTLMWFNVRSRSGKWGSGEGDAG